jgi:hypothetical protein
MIDNPELDHAVEKRNEAYYSFCDKLIALSTGAIALSVTLKSSFVPTSPNYLWTLKLSWICFTVSILAALIIQWGRAWIWNKRVKEIRNNEYSEGRLPKSYSLARWVMFISFIIAILSFVFFAIANLQSA